MNIFSVSFVTYSLGCRTNQAELEDISTQLIAYGLQTADYRLQQDLAQNHLPQPLSPNLVLINTCMVTSKAERETRKAIRHFRKLYPQAKIVVLGCAVTAKEVLKINLPEADLLINNNEKSKASEIIVKFLRSTSCCNMTHDRGLYCNNNDTHCYDYLSNYAESGRKFIKIQDGCNNCCSFCITTHLRGKPRSEGAEKLIKLISGFQPKVDQPLAEVNSGIKEVILTGINISLYGNDLKPQIGIWSLVDRILNETKVERLTLSTIYPEMLYGVRTVLPTRTVLWHRTVLYDTIRNPRLSRCFHLALQSGSPSVLQRMNRPTDLKKLLEAIDVIRKIQPDFTFRADIITGFPGETEEEHQETLEFVRQAKISFAHVFPYSSRPKTVAHEMILKKKWQEISSETKKRRAREIRLAVGELGSKLGRGMVGKMYRVLIIREITTSGTDSGQVLRQAQGVARMTCWEGITENGWSVLVQNSPPKADQPLAEKCKPIKGSFMEVKITGHEKDQLVGEIVSLPI